MQLLGSIIYVTSTFYYLEGVVYQYIGLTPFLYFHITSIFQTFQDGIFHKKIHKKLWKLRIDSFCHL